MRSRRSNITPDERYAPKKYGGYTKNQKEMPASRIELEIFALLCNTSATRYHCAMSARIEMLSSQWKLCELFGGNDKFEYIAPKSISFHWRERSGAVTAPALSPRLTLTHHQHTATKSSRYGPWRQNGQHQCHIAISLKNHRNRQDRSDVPSPDPHRRLATHVLHFDLPTSVMA